MRELVADDAERLERSSLGFWIYLMTDCVLFAALFAAYVVLRRNTAGGPLPAELFNMNFVMAETLILLTSSLTCGIFMIAAKQKKQQQFMAWIGVTFALGLAFLLMEVVEFRHLVADGVGWTRSAFLSSYFTLVGTHGLHITVGLLWIAVLVYTVYKRGIDDGSIRKLTMLSLFWHFLDIIWILIFSIVYLLGKVS
jgi:cytochrome o ubiquinol oxidase subunit 3